LSACGSSDKKETPTEIVIEQNSNAILEPIQVIKSGYNNIDIHSKGVDEDGIDHVDFYAIHN
jgi:hypothetical protein